MSSKSLLQTSRRFIRSRKPFYYVLKIMGHLNVRGRFVLRVKELGSLYRQAAAYWWWHT